MKIQRRILVIGSLLELALECETIHRKLGSYIDNIDNIDYIICFGDETLYISDQMQSSTAKKYHAFSYEEVVRYIEIIGLDSSTAMYIKGSGAMRMEIIGLHCLSELSKLGNQHE
jgi:UDP-N-acetylmuramyl pentapeptide synthase